MLDDITFNDNYILRIINKLNTKKAHRLDGISISLLKMCAKEVTFPLRLIFTKALECGKFPQTWKLANVQPVHKKKEQAIDRKLQTYLYSTYMRKDF